MRLLELSCRSGDKLLVNATTSCDAEEVFETRVDWQIETVVEATGRAIEGVVAVEGVPSMSSFISAVMAGLGLSAAAESQVTTAVVEAGAD